MNLKNQFFSADISPVCDRYGCKAFILSINNHTNKDIEVVWDKTMYIVSGRTSGGFMFEGVVFRERHRSKPPDIVFANSRFSKAIWPSNLVHFTSGKHAGWRHRSMPSGENGVYLTVKIGEDEIKEKVLLNLSKEEIKK